jgi:hypothetical protein
MNDRVGREWKLNYTTWLELGVMVGGMGDWSPVRTTAPHERDRRGREDQISDTVCIQDRTM